MTSRREQIIQAITTALTGTTGLGSRIWRSRAEAVSRNESPALLIEPATETPIDPEGSEGLSFPYLDRRLIVKIGVITRGPIPDQLADPILVDVHQRLMTNAGLAGLTISVYPGPVDWEQADADTTAGVAICDWVIRYRTAVNDITI
jgi:hypothetical protein